jgi:hypothetical protein
MPVWAALLTMCGALLLVAAVLAYVGITLMRRAASKPLPEEAIAEAQLTMDALEEELHDAGLT